MLFSCLRSRVDLVSYAVLITPCRATDRWAKTSVAEGNPFKTNVAGTARWGCHGHCNIHAHLCFCDPTKVIFLPLFFRSSHGGKSGLGDKESLGFLQMHYHFLAVCCLTSFTLALSPLLSLRSVMANNNYSSRDLWLWGYKMLLCADEMRILFLTFQLKKRETHKRPCAVVW